MAKSPERPDHYAILKVPRTADAAALRRAYRLLALEWHPDRQQGDPEATERFQRLAEAYAVLGDPASREKYDAGQKVAVPFEPGGSVSELLGKVTDQLFGVRAKRPIDGHEVTYRLTLSFAEAVLGTERTLLLPRQEVCGRCAGRGFSDDTIPEICERCEGCGERVVRRSLRKELEDCPACTGRGYLVARPCGDCGGKGVVAPQRPLLIRVPPGVKDGDRLLIREAGQPGLHGGRNGDCTVHSSVTPHPVLRMVGRDVEAERPVPILVAVAGGTLRVPTVEGGASIRVPAGTRDGTRLRMLGHGVRDRTGDGRGDQIVTVRLEYPAQLDEATAAGLRGVAATLGEAAFPESHAFDRACDPEADR